MSFLCYTGRVNRKFVEPNINGFLVKPKDVRSLVTAMLTLAKDSELRFRLGKNGRKKVLEDFDEKIVILKTLEVYRKSGLKLT